MIILDTNVISALMRPDLNPIVVAWLDQQPAATIWTTSVSILEARTGMLMLPDGRRKSAMAASFDRLLSMTIADRVLSFDQHAAEIAADFSAIRIRAGKNMTVPDILIAGIAIARSATLATRNTRDFSDLDIRLVDPWDA